MDIHTVAAFFQWCLLINLGLYLLTVVAMLAMPDLVSRLNARIFRVSQDTVRQATFAFVAGYKLLIIVFNLVPWLALLIIDKTG